MRALFASHASAAVIARSFATLLVVATAGGITGSNAEAARPSAAPKVAAPSPLGAGPIEERFHGLPVCAPEEPGIVDRILLNPPRPDEFALIQFVGAQAQATFEAMTEVPTTQSRIGDDRFFERQGRNLECSAWVLHAKACVEYHCSVAFNDIKNGTARSEY